MLPLYLVILTLFILFCSTLTRSTFGFGDALIAMPLLTLVVGIQIATPLVALISITIAFIIVGTSWQNIDLSSAWRLIVASIAGVPIGLFILKTAPEDLVKAILGILLILFGLYSLFKPVLISIRQPRWAYGFGFVAGILGGAYNTHGPPLVLYGTLRHWSPARFRATLQGYFVCTGMFLVLGHAVSGLLTVQVLQLSALALPVTGLAIFMGGKLNQRISTQKFERILYVALIVLGVMLFI